MTTKLIKRWEIKNKTDGTVVANGSFQHAADDPEWWISYCIKNSMQFTLDFENLEVHYYIDEQETIVTTVEHKVVPVNEFIYKTV